MSFLTRIKKSIPNFLTCCSLFFGCVAICYAMGWHFEEAMWCVVIGAVFDFSDGFAARALNASSPIGKELDSLADQVSFGVAPGFIVLFWIRSKSLIMPDVSAIVQWIAFLIPIFSALRLAKFNVDTRQTSSFIGLATPANAIFFASLAASDFEFLEISGWIMVGLVVVFSLLLVSEIPMFSLKFKHFGLNGNEDKFLLIGFAILTLISTVVIDGFTIYRAIPLIILFYIAICLFELIKSKKQA